VEAGQAGVVGVLHCYTGSHELAERAIESGWYVSFSGIVTFRNWRDDDLLRLVPDDRILAESDSPYLAPVPNRGKRNEPGWVRHTVGKLAAARGIPAGAMAAMVSQNARRLFALA
jgi:TatD DNase family protein